MVEGGRRDNIQEKLGKNDGEVQLEPKERNFRPTQEKNVDRFL